MSTLTAKIQLRRDTAANWATNNPILAAGEVAFTSDIFYTSTDQQRFKIGDGVQTWSQLDYVPEGGGGSSFPEHLYLTVVNKTGDNLLASGYKVVKVSSAQGQRLAIDYAQANNDANSADTIGVVYENINNNQEGKIVTIGELTGLNTTGSLQSETWTDGDVLYLSPFNEGQITNIKPTAPNHLVTLGYVVYAHANNGKIYVKCDNGYEIGELHDVYAPSPSNNDGIFWSSGTNRYENKSISTALGYTPAKVSILPLYFGSAQNTLNPADSTTYYFANTSIPATNFVSRYMPISTAVTVIACSFEIWVNSTIGSSENSQIDLLVYNSSDVLQSTNLISNTVKWDSAAKTNKYFITGLNYSIPANSYIVLKLTTPAWVTNPTVTWGTFNLSLI